MARRMRRSSRRMHERKITHRQWYTTSGITNITLNLAQGTGNQNVSKLFVDPLKGDDQTILRTRGFVVPQMAQISTDLVCVLGGIVLPNRVANDASISELPNPLVDADTTDWFVWQPFLKPYSSTGGTEDQRVEQASAIPLEVDSKAKRIMEASESVVWIIGYNAATNVTSDAFRVAYCLRTLVGY